MKIRNHLCGALAVVAVFAAAPHHSHAQVLSGDFLHVGVNASGGLIDAGFNTGIDYDATGTGTWSRFDFIKPGIPYEFYAVGYNGNSTSAGFLRGNPLGAATTVTSTGDTLSAVTSGNFGSLALRQDLSFNKRGSVIDFTVHLANTGATALTDVVYARGLDADQDVYAGGGYGTTNSILSNNLVTSTAPVTGWTIGLFSDSGYAHTPSILATWPTTNPYRLQTAQNDGNGDYSINLAWNIGTLAPGESATIDFQYRIGSTLSDVIAIPEPKSYAMVLGAATLGFVMLRRRCPA